MNLSIELNGIDDVKDYLDVKHDKIFHQVNLGLNRSGELLKNEIKESIEGHRAEPRSVDTGEFLDSIETQSINTNEISVFSDVPQSVFMEYGNSRISPRRHFSNSLARNEKNIVELVRSEVNQTV